MTVKKTLRFILGLLIAALFVWLITQQINPAEFKQAFADTNQHWIIAGFVAFSIGYMCRIERWRQMLKCDNTKLRWIDCFGPLLASFATNNVLPFRAGDILRAFAFNGRLGVSSSVVLATLFVERLLDLLMVLILLGSALLYFRLDVNNFAGVGSIALIGMALGILLVLLFPRLFAPLAIGIGLFIKRLAPGIGEKLLLEIKKIMLTLQHLAKGYTMFRLVLWSLAAWLAEGCVFWFAGLALSSIGAPLAGWLALPVGTLSTLIPSTPGYVGTFDYFTVRAMSALGNDTTPATAYALLVHILLWLPPTIIGGAYLLLHPTKTSKPVSLSSNKKR